MSDHAVEATGGQSAPENDASAGSGQDRIKVPLGQRIRSMIDAQVVQSRDLAHQEAAVELQQAMEPSRQQLLLNVPGSTSPEEAQSILDRQTSIELEPTVTVSPSSLIDLRNPTSMGAYPPAEKLSNRVLRLTNRHWAKQRPRRPSDIRAEKAAIAEREFARKPSGTQRCLARHDSLRCRGVFVYLSSQQAEGVALACPSCGARHRWDAGGAGWAVDLETGLARRKASEAITSSN